MSTLRVASIVASLALASTALAQGGPQGQAVRPHAPAAAPVSAPPASTGPAAGAAQPAPATPAAAQSAPHGNEKALGKAKSLGRKLFDRGAQLGASKAKPLVGAKAAEKAAKAVTKKGEPHVDDVVENAADFLNAWRGKDAPREGAR
jgi:hypothetical protein